MEGPIGVCSICGGEVIGHIGPWHSILPPPPGRCTSCGATEARGRVIPMVPMPRPLPNQQPLTQDGTARIHNTDTWTTQ